jgi:hypothetical protein
MTYENLRGTDAIMEDDLTDIQEPELPLPEGIRLGQSFNHLLVTGRATNDASGRVRLTCVCSCQEECIARLSDLKSGHTKSCGHLRAAVLRRRFGKIRNQQFGTLKAIGKTDPTLRTTASTEWLTVCVLCGRIVWAKTWQLRLGKKRCSCMDATYNSWRTMIQRCTNKNFTYYDGYMGRGITVCQSWRESFQQFANDMGKRPEDKTLHRIDNNWNYQRGNCCWATTDEQARNRRSGKTEPVFDETATAFPFPNRLTAA